MHFLLPHVIFFFERNNEKVTAVSSFMLDLHYLSNAISSPLLFRRGTMFCETLSWAGQNVILLPYYCTLPYNMKCREALVPEIGVVPLDPRQVAQ